MAREIFIAERARVEEWQDPDALSLFGYMISYIALRDRFGYLNQFSPYRLTGNPLPFPARNSTVTLSDLMDERAVFLLNKFRSENKQAYIFLSGGVDSTALTIAVLKAANGDYSNLHVVYTEATEWENRPFVDLLRKTGIDMIRQESVKMALYQAEIVKTDYVLTGWVADQLFGSVINAGWPDWYFKDWRLWFREFAPYDPETAINQLEAAFEYYDLPIRRFGQMTWFFNFATKYNLVTHGDVITTGIITNRMIAFFDAPGFSDWSVSNFDVLHDYSQADSQHYKIALKDYIFDYNHDEEYRLKKGKVTSWLSPRFGQWERGIPSYTILESPEKAVTVRHHMRVKPSLIHEKHNILARNLLRFYRKH